MSELPEPRSSNRLPPTGPHHPSGDADSPRLAPGSAEVVPTAGLGAFVPFDPLRLILALRRRIVWLILGAILVATPVGLLGAFRLQTSYTVPIQLIRRELPNSFRASELGEAFKPRQFSIATVVAMMRSPSLLAKVGNLARPKLSANALLSGLIITPERNTDLINVSIRSSVSAAAATELVNAYAQEVVELTRTLQQQEAAELDRFLRDQLGRTEGDLAEINQEILRFTRAENFLDSDKEIEAYLRNLSDAETALQNTKLEAETVAFRIAALEAEISRQNPAIAALEEARARLKTLLVDYTEANPIVVDQQSRIAALETEAATSTNVLENFQAGANTVANAMFIDLVNLRAQREALQSQLKQFEERRVVATAKLRDLPEKGMKYAKLKARQLSLETTRAFLSGRQREARLFSENSPGYYRLFAPASENDVIVSNKSRKLVLATAAAALAGLVAAFLLVCLLEALDERVVSPADLRRATRLPVVGRIEDFNTPDVPNLATWRYRTWSALSRILADSHNPSGSLFCGLLSAQAGEGRSTWIRLLAEAARERGHRTVRVQPAPTTSSPTAAPAAAQLHLPLPDALASPALLIEALQNPDLQDVFLEIPAGFGWPPTRRFQWAHALQEWRSLGNLILFLELPPASHLESILLAETMPAVLWLSASGINPVSEIGSLLETAREGRTRLKGALLNRMPGPFRHLPDLARFGFLLAGACLLAFAQHAIAQAAPETSETIAAELPIEPPTNQEPAAVTNQFLSATAAGPKLAPWQERLELGPGDVINLVTYGQPDSARNGVAIGPDGRINYLQAAGVKASGLTIDELRDHLSAELQKYRKNARVIVTPSSWRSKKYYLLGTVIDRGAYPLDRPITIIEAIARARGIATGLLEQNTVEIADLPRAFLVRDRQRLPVDFVKLFQQGDLSQNIPLAPGDYLYFPSSTLNEIYILGSVVSPGSVGVSPGSSVVGIITTRGGFTQKAYRQRVLIVRGSLNQPETHIVNVAEILRGKAMDFRLEPKDIVFVSNRPWSKVEDLLDTAITAFITTAVSTWTGLNVPNAIQEPVIPSL